MKKHGSMFGWERPRNWFGSSPSGSWTFIRPRSEFMEVFDAMVVVAFFALLWLGMTFSEHLGLVVAGVAVILYYWMAFQGEVISKAKVWTSAVIDYGSSSRLWEYLMLAAVLVVINLVVMFALNLQVKDLLFVLPMNSLITMVVVNIITIPFVLGVERGVFAPYLAESFGIIPSVLGMGLINGVFFGSSEAFLPLVATSIMESVYAYVVLWKKATAPPIIASILLTAGYLIWS